MVFTLHNDIFEKKINNEENSELTDFFLNYKL